MADTSLLLMLDEVRTMTLRHLEGVTDAESRFAPPGLSNSILWHAGHIYVVVERLTMEPLGREPIAPEGWIDLFGWDSRPGETPPEKFPPLGEVVPQLQSQHVRLSEMLAEFSDAELSAPLAERPDRTARHLILHGFQDEASHKGEIWLLKKLWARHGA
ncbi:DinB family protein [Blastopirellula sp. JC732]|uniref:DinB family protein n=1 Tax=Blastopirellula sediminis TaxID=2894196 RepID=A0A9X1MLQ4_9BACT|nr:DinB family protein [Blastopirellula sediminis]MCC9607349.1 DinB family protein [Blastopirellula sediminis]MCC9629358.1 DinB family protein [Blastopirellula sediminis]